jgi:HD superfamily phosphohydrolase
VVVDIIWGKENTESPLIQDLLDSAIMKRLQGVDQSGPCRYFGYAPAYSRYEHCVGVWALLKRFNCSLPEQVAGLLHDASHTAFSHLADHLFATPQTEHSYHDTIHLWFLRQMKLQPLLAMYDLSLKQMDVDHPGYKGLKQPLPDLCADRIEYNLHTGILFKIISTEEAKKILNNLKFENGRWFFTSVDSAKKFANLSLYLTEHFWGAPWYYVFNHYFKEIVQRAIDLGQISRDQIHFGTDKQVMDILVKSEDPYIQRRLQGCRCIQQSFKVVETHPYNIHFKPKFRGLNPWVQKGEMFYRLTDLDPDFNKAFHALKTKCQQGFKILLKVID